MGSLNEDLKKEIKQEAFKVGRQSAILVKDVFGIIDEMIGNN